MGQDDLFNRLYDGEPKEKPEPEEKQETESGTPTSRSARAFLESLKRQDNA